MAAKWLSGLHSELPLPLVCGEEFEVAGEGAEEESEPVDERG